MIRLMMHMNIKEMTQIENRNICELLLRSFLSTERINIIKNITIACYDSHISRHFQHKLMVDSINVYDE